MARERKAGAALLQAGEWGSGMINRGVAGRGRKRARARAGAVNRWILRWVEMEILLQ